MSDRFNLSKVWNCLAILVRGKDQSEENWYKKEKQEIE